MLPGAKNPKMHDFNKKLRRFARMTRETTRTTREITRMTRVRTRTTCRRHITREFGLKSRKKWGGENREKNFGGATVTFYFFGSIPS